MAACCGCMLWLHAVVAVAKIREDHSTHHVSVCACVCCPFGVQVYTAKRAALLRVAEEEQRGYGGGAAAATAAARKRKHRQKQAAAAGES